MDEHNRVHCGEHGTILQLVAVGIQQGANDTHEKPSMRAARGYDEVIRDVGGPSYYKYTIQRANGGDIISGLFLQMKVKAAPPGFRWKHCWPLHFIKSFTISIGNEPIWTTTGEGLRIKYLVDGFVPVPAWQKLYPTAQYRRTKGSLFEYEPEERTELSSRPHEICFEPISIENVIEKGYIPYINIPYHDITVEIATNPLESCIEPIAGSPAGELAMAADDYIEYCNILREFYSFDTEERRNLSREGGSHKMVQTKHMAPCSETFDIAEGGETIKLDIDDADLTCSAVYVWISDEENNEIPYQVVDSLSSIVNTHVRQTLSGEMARFIEPKNLPHPTLENNISKNLYYISYFPGRLQNNGLEQGMNLSRIDTYQISLKFNEKAPRRVKVNIVHRVQNSLHITNGMAGKYMVSLPFRINSRIVVANEPIEISEEQPACLITHVDFKNNDLVDQCLTCNKIVSTEAMAKWVMHNNLKKKCIHCSSPYIRKNFKRALAKLIYEPVIHIKDEVLNDKKEDRILPGSPPLGAALTTEPVVDWVEPLGQANYRRGQAQARAQDTPPTILGRISSFFGYTERRGAYLRIHPHRE